MKREQLEAWAREVGKHDHLTYVGKDITLLDAKLGVVLVLKQHADRIAELNAAMVKLANELPYPEEVRDWTEQRRKLIAEIGTLLAERDEAKRTLAELECEPSPIPMILFCPICGGRHIDSGEFATKPHHTHACQICGVVWRPAIEATVGVAFLPGLKNEVATQIAANSVALTLEEAEQRYKEARDDE